MFFFAQPLTAQDILNLLRTVDGVGSNLDADLLQGNVPSAFAASAHSHTGYATTGEVENLFSAMLGDATVSDLWDVSYTPNISVGHFLRVFSTGSVNPNIEWRPSFIDWSEIQSKPASFAPSAHSQDASTITTGVFDNARIPANIIRDTDTRLTNSREWSAPTVTQIEAEAGNSTTRLAFTPLRIFQAISAWWNASAFKAKLDGIAVNANNYVHPTDDGNLHVPATGIANNLKVLKAGGTAGNLYWGNIPWSEITSKPNFLNKDNANTVNEAVLLDATGKIPPEYIPNNPFAVATNLYEIATYSNFTTITVEMRDVNNTFEWYFYKLGEAELGGAAIIKKIGNTATFDNAIENPTGQSVAVLVDVKGNGNLNTVSYMRLQGDSSQRTIFIRNVIPPNLTELVLQSCGNLDYSRLTNVKRLTHNQVVGVPINLAGLIALESFSSTQNSITTFTTGTHPNLHTFSLQSCPNITINFQLIPKIRTLNFGFNNLTATQLETIIQGIYDLEQTRTPIASCSFNSSSGTNATPNANTLSLINWLRTNKGWTITHN